MFFTFIGIHNSRNDGDAYSGGDRGDIRKLGASGTSFAPICASAERGALPHAVPTSHKIKEGDLLTIDMGAMADGYAGDMTRTIGIGYLTDEQKNSMTSCSELSLQV